MIISHPLQRSRGLWLVMHILFYLVLLACTEGQVSSARLPDIYWNSTNPIFRIDNTDHIIDVNRGNVAYEYDQINIICPMYSKGTREEDTEAYIIYNVSKEEYDSCHIANPAIARTIAVCDKPYLNRYYTITFRPFTPQPGGLEFRPGQDYYFIALSAKPGEPNPAKDCHRHHMKVVFKVCCGKRPSQPSIGSKGLSSGNSSSSANANASSVSTSTSIPAISSSTMPYGVATYPGVILGNAGSILNNINMGTGLANINRNDSLSIRSNAHHSGPSVNPRSPSSSPPVPSSSFNFNKPERNLPGSFSSDVAIYRDGQQQQHQQTQAGGQRSNLPNVYQPNRYGPSTVRPYYPPGVAANGPPPSRIYHPNHPSQITSTQTPWWRPHHPKIRDGYDRPADQGYHYNKKYKDRDRRPNDIKEKSDGLNSGTSGLDLRCSTIIVIIAASSLYCSSWLSWRRH